MPNVAWTRMTLTQLGMTALGVAALGVSAPACGTSSASTGSGSDAPLAVNSAAHTVEEAPAPPHVFTPRPHPARIHEPPPEPNLASLPKLVDRSRSCFFVPEPEPVAPVRNGWGRGGGGNKKVAKKKKKKKRSKRPPGYVPYGGGGKKSGSKAKGSAGAVPGGIPGGVVGGVSGGTLGGVSSGIGSKSSKPSTATKRDSSRKDRDPKREQKAKRRPKPKPEPKPAPMAQPAEPAPVADFEESVVAGADDALVTESREPGPTLATNAEEEFNDWGSATYLSNDDTMSLSSAQRVIFAIDNFLPLPAEHIRPHELLNYFSFHTDPVAEGNDFSIKAAIAPDPDEEGIYSLAMAVRGRPLTVEDRRNTNLSVVIDRSGSMSAEGRMEYLQRGLLQMTDQLKRGDMVHLVLFDHDVCTPVENFVVGRDDPRILQSAIRSLEPRGSTDLHDGLRTGYQIADRAYQPTYSNRVVMVTDAITNTGVTDERLISTVSKFYDERRIRLSGVGVGRDFNDSLLDRLTERGKGAYVFLGSEAEVDAVFGSRFTSLIETTALDVHFQLHLPPSLRMNTFYGEESSTIKEDVQAVHYFANTSQLFLSDLMAKGGQLRPQDSVMLTVEYEDPESGDEMIEEYAFNLGEISQADPNVRKGRMIIHFIDGLAWMAARPQPHSWGRNSNNHEEWEACEAGREQLATMARGLEGDPEVERVIELWDKFCKRFPKPEGATRRAPPDTWPSAAG